MHDLVSSITWAWHTFLLLLPTLQLSFFEELRPMAPLFAGHPMQVPLQVFLLLLFRALGILLRALLILADRLKGRGGTWVTQLRSIRR